MVEIQKIKRLEDEKVFELGDSVYVDDIFRGFIDGMQQFQDDFRIHVNVDEDSRDLEYYSIKEID